MRRESVQRTLFKDLRKFYDPGQNGGDQGDQELYTDVALLKRESLKFEPKIQHVMTRLYKVVKSNFGDTINREE